MARHVVLLVEDDADIRACLEEVLDEEGYLVVPARDGEMALRYLLEHPLPSVMILDMHMPVMDGREVLAAIGRDARFEDLPVILFTAGSDAYDRSMTRGYPVLRKPIHLDDLLRAIAVSCKESGVVAIASSRGVPAEVSEG